MCTAFVDNMTLGVFYVDAYAKVELWKEFVAFVSMEYWKMIQQRLSFCCIATASYGLFSVALRLCNGQLRHSFPRTSTVDFYVTFLRCCYVRCCWFGILAWEIRLNSSLRETNVSHFFLTHFKFAKYFSFPLFSSLCDKLSCDTIFSHFFSSCICWVFAVHRRILCTFFFILIIHSWKESFPGIV